MTEDQKKRIVLAKEGDCNFDGMPCHPRIFNYLLKAGFKTITDIENMSEKEFATRMHIFFEERYPDVNEHFDKTDKVIDILKTNGITFKADGDEVMAETMYRAALRFASEGDFSRFAFLMEEAVKNGFKGDYSSLGSLYLVGKGVVEQDLEQAEKWYKRFIDEYEKGLLKVEDKTHIFSILYNLGVLLLIKAENDNSDKLRDEALSYFRRGIECYERKEYDLKDSVSEAENFYLIGGVFAGYNIKLQGVDIDGVTAEMQCAKKALEIAYSLGYKEAKVRLEELVEDKFFKEYHLMENEIYSLSTKLPDLERKKALKSIKNKYKTIIEESKLISIDDHDKENKMVVLRKIGTWLYYGQCNIEDVIIDIPAEYNLAREIFSELQRLGDEEAEYFLSDLSDEDEIEIESLFSFKTMENESYSSDYCYIGIDDDVFEIIPENGYLALISTIFGERFYITALQLVDENNVYLKNVVSHVLDTLNDEDRIVIESIYGLNGNRQKSRREIGRDELLSFSRVWGIEARAYRKMRHPSRSRLLKNFLIDLNFEKSENFKPIVNYGPYFEEIIKREVEYYKDNPECDTSDFFSKNIINSFIRDDYDPNYDPSGIKNLSIDELELGVRAYNCLRRAGIETVGDVLALTDEELMKVRNLGRKSMEEVIEKVQQIYNNQKSILWFKREHELDEFKIFNLPGETPITQIDIPVNTMIDLLRIGFLYYSDLENNLLSMYKNTDEYGYGLINEVHGIINRYYLQSKKIRRVYFPYSLRLVMKEKGYKTLKELSGDIENLPWSIQQQLKNVIYWVTEDVERMKQSTEEETLSTKDGNLSSVSRGKYHKSINRLKIYKKSTSLGEDDIYSLWTPDLEKCICTTQQCSFRDLEWIANLIEYYTKDGQTTSYDLNDFLKKDAEYMSHSIKAICALHDFNSTYGIKELESIEMDAEYHSTKTITIDVSDILEKIIKEKYDL